LQVNSRLFADGDWRGVDAAAMLRMTRALNGIGHRAVLSHPAFREALSRHGFTLRADGELNELATAVPAMSKRSNQIGKNAGKYEREWRKKFPNIEPTRKQIRAWNAAAWNDGRQAKNKRQNPTPADQVEAGWLTELRDLGIDVDAMRLAPEIPMVGKNPLSVDREAAAARAVQIVASGPRGKSTWNLFDLRGAAEEVIAEMHIIGDPTITREIAEDVTARAKLQCQSVLDIPLGSPAHIRHLTSQAVIDLEHDLNTRLGVRAMSGHTPGDADRVHDALALSGRSLAFGQFEAVRAVTGTGKVVCIEGPAGSGKTTMLATARDIVAARGGQMRVVAPSKKAAMVAAEEINVPGNTAASLAYAHGFRWDAHGVWSRLEVGDTDPYNRRRYNGPSTAAMLTAQDVLVVDEAGMMAQETAQALLHIADEADARIVFVGDRRQLAAVGRGGVMDIAAAWAPAWVEMDSVHRFRKADGSLDQDYADLSLRIRDGADPAAVFDELHKSGHIVMHKSEAEVVDMLATEIVERHLAGVSQSVGTATNEAVEAINEEVRSRLVAAGAVDDDVTAHGSDGLRMGRGDKVMTRENNTDYHVTNRMSWRVEEVKPDGSVALCEETKKKRKTRTVVPPEYVREHVHLAYATTLHGVQGETSSYGSMYMTSATDAAGTYVGMTRGKLQNHLHVVAADVADAREQWVQAADRERADIGLVPAKRDARGERAQYATSRPSMADLIAARIAATEGRDPDPVAEDAYDSYGPQPVPSNNRGRRPRP